MAAHRQDPTKIEALGSAFGRLLAVPALLVLCAAGLYSIGDAAFASAPASKDPGFVDGVLASTAVLAAVRLAIIAAAGYIVVSVVALAASRQWLTRVGPVEVSARVSDLESENAALRGMLDSAEERVEDLHDELANADNALKSVLDSIGEAWKDK